MKVLLFKNTVSTPLKKSMKKDFTNVKPAKTTNIFYKNQY